MSSAAGLEQAGAALAQLEGLSDRGALERFAFEGTVEVAGGLVGRRRVLDSAPIYDAVATQDTITLIRSAIRGLLRAEDAVSPDSRSAAQRDVSQSISSTEFRNLERCSTCVNSAFFRNVT